MSFPEIQGVLVCEEVRPELNKKNQILGFFGIAPEVHILIRSLEEPMPRIGFLFVTTRSKTSGDHKLKVTLHDPEGQTIAVVGVELVLQPGRSIQFGFGLQGVKMKKGQYSLSTTLDGEALHETSFNVSVGTPEDFQG